MNELQNVKLRSKGGLELNNVSSTKTTEKVETNNQNNLIANLKGSKFRHSCYVSSSSTSKPPLVLNPAPITETDVDEIVNNDTVNTVSSAASTSTPAVAVNSTVNKDAIKPTPPVRPQKPKPPLMQTQTQATTTSTITTPFPVQLRKTASNKDNDTSKNTTASGNNNDKDAKTDNNDKRASVKELVQILSPTESKVSNHE